MTSAILAGAILVALGIIGPLVWVVVREVRAAVGILRDRDEAVSERLEAEAKHKQEQHTSAALREQLGILRADLEQARDDLDGCADPDVVRARLERLFVRPEAEAGGGASSGPVPEWVTNPDAVRSGPVDA